MAGSQEASRQDEKSFECEQNRGEFFSSFYSLISKVYSRED